MKKLIWLLPLLIILGAMLVTVMKSSAQTREVTINYDYGNLTDTKWSCSFGAARVSS